MKTLMLVIFTCLLIGGCSTEQGPDYSKEIPPLKSRVNDYADLFSQEAKDSLENRLAAYEALTTTQIVVLTVPSIGEYAIEEYSIKVAESWKIGTAEKDNGVLITVAEEQKKVRIETGYGVEGALPDGQCWYIIEHCFLPEVKKKSPDFDAAIENTVTAIIRSLAGEFEEVKQETEDKEMVMPFVVVLIIISVVLGFINAGSDSWLPGAIGGLISFPVTYLFFWSAGILPILGLAALGFIIGAIAGFILQAMAEGSGGSSGGYYGGSSSSSSFGGFSGGGGSFGGGGASGGW